MQTAVYVPAHKSINISCAGRAAPASNSRVRNSYCSSAVCAAPASSSRGRNSCCSSAGLASGISPHALESRKCGETSRPSPLHPDCHLTLLTGCRIPTKGTSKWGPLPATQPLDVLFAETSAFASTPAGWFCVQGPCIAWLCMADWGEADAKASHGPDCTSRVRPDLSRVFGRFRGAPQDAGTGTTGLRRRCRPTRFRLRRDRHRAPGRFGAPLRPAPASAHPEGHRLGEEDRGPSAPCACLPPRGLAAANTQTNPVRSRTVSRRVASRRVVTRCDADRDRGVGKARGEGRGRRTRLPHTNNKARPIAWVREDEGSVRRQPPRGWRAHKIPPRPRPSSKDSHMYTDCERSTASPPPGAG
eukprot:364963-Chlamydomonas_euryale.AAC.5